MSALITNDGLGHPKPRNDIILHEFDHNLVVIGFSGNSLYLLRHVIYSQKDVEEPIRTRKKGPIKSIPQQSKISMISIG